MMTKEGLRLLGKIVKPEFRGIKHVRHSQSGQIILNREN